VHGDSKDLSGLTTFSRGNFEMVSANGRLSTYDAGGRSRLPGDLATDSDDQWVEPGRTSPGQAAMVDAHFFANVTDSYFLNVLQFNWLSHYSQGMVSTAHVKRNYNNAYWNGYQMAYGDGDGISFINLSGDLDVVG
ncbi:peptidase M4, partial [Vibrio vulnificus]